MDNWMWDNQHGRQLGPYGQPQVGALGNWGQWPPAGPNQAPAYSPYSQPGGPLGLYGEQSGPYGQPQVVAPGNWGQSPLASPNHEAPAYSPYNQPGGPLGPYAGQTGFSPQQYGQNSLLLMPPGHLSNVRSNQNQQREMGMRKGSGQTGGQRSDHRGRGRGHGRGRGKGGRKENNTDEKNSEVPVRDHEQESAFVKETMWIFKKNS